MNVKKTACYAAVGFVIIAAAVWAGAEFFTWNMERKEAMNIARGSGVPEKEY